MSKPDNEGRNHVTRRIRIDLNTPAELAIRAATVAVEEAGCHPLLTDAVNLLTQAREKVADFVDEVPVPVIQNEWTPLVDAALLIDAACASRDAKIDKMRRVLNQSLLALDQLMGDTDLADDDSLEMKTCQAILQVLHEGPLSETDKAWIDDA